MLFLIYLFSPHYNSSFAIASSSKDRRDFTPTTPGNGVLTPTPIQGGMTTSCKTFHFVTDGQTYQVITARYGITQANFVKWNPAAKSDCTGKWANAYGCVAVL